MKFREHILLVALAIGFVTLGYSQRGTIDIRNGFAIGGGITQYDILTDNFETTKGDGWMIHASATGDIPHRWYNVSYGMQMAENNFEVSGRTSNTASEDVQIGYKVFTAQLAFLGHAKLFQGILTIDAGPMVQYNGNLELNDNRQENYLINNYNNLTAEDIKEISNIHINGAIGATLGFGRLKVKAQYIYSFTNMLNKLNSQDLDTSGFSGGNFKGKQSMLAFTGMFTF